LCGKTSLPGDRIDGPHLNNEQAEGRQPGQKAEGQGNATDQFTPSDGDLNGREVPSLRQRVLLAGLGPLVLDRLPGALVFELLQYRVRRTHLLPPQLLHPFSPPVIIDYLIKSVVNKNGRQGKPQHQGGKRVFEKSVEHGAPPSERRDRGA